MHKKCEILIFCTVFVVRAAFCQSSAAAGTAKHAAIRPVFTFSTLQKPLFPADGYVRTLGFFCRQEIKMDRRLPVSFRFRLGSTEQCDWLEGKRVPGR